MCICFSSSISSSRCTFRRACDIAFLMFWGKTDKVGADQSFGSWALGVERGFSKGLSKEFFCHSLLVLVCRARYEESRKSLQKVVFRHFFRSSYQKKKKLNETFTFPLNWKLVKLEPLLAVASFFFTQCKVTKEKTELAALFC